MSEMTGAVECMGKIGYGSRSEARKALTAIQKRARGKLDATRRRRRDLSAYLCPGCQAWHLGTMPPRGAGGHAGAK